MHSLHIRHRVDTDTSRFRRYVGRNDNTTKEVSMFDQLTRELLDLAAEVRGDRSRAFALIIDCCSCTCSCSGCVSLTC